MTFLDVENLLPLKVHLAIPQQSQQEQLTTKLGNELGHLQRHIYLVACHQQSRKYKRVISDF
jgi:hypothetical protein